MTSTTISFVFDDAAIPLPYRVDPTSTFVIADSLNDQHVNRTGTTYPPTGTITVVTNAPGITAIRNHDPTLTNPFTIRNGLFRWDTSTAWLTAADQISGARFVGYLVNTQIDDARSLTMDWFAWSGVNADYSETAQTNAHSGTLISGLTLNAENTLTLDNAAANVNKSGMTYLRSHVSGDVPTGKNIASFSSFDDTTAGRIEPTLLVDYVTDVTPPAVPTGLAATVITE